MGTSHCQAAFLETSPVGTVPVCTHCVLGVPGSLLPVMEVVLLPVSVVDTVLLGTSLV